MNVLSFHPATQPDLLARFLSFRASSDRERSADPGADDPHAARLLAAGPGEWPRSQGVRWCCFLAQDDEGRPVGRLAAIVNPAITDAEGRPYGQLGFLAVAEDKALAGGHLAAAAALTTEADRWLAGQDVTIATVLAPMNIDAWHAYRVMVSGQDERPFQGEPRNPPWLPELLAACGFAPHSEHITKTIARPAAAVTAWVRFHTRAVGRGITFEAMAPADWDMALGRAFRLSLEVFRDLPLFCSLPESEFRALYAGADGLLEPGGLLFAVGPDGSDLGLSFAFRQPGRPQDLYLKSFGVRPEWRGTGLAAAFTAQVYRIWLERGVTRVHHCLMGINESSARFDRGTGEVTRRYQLFARPLARARP